MSSQRMKIILGGTAAFFAASEHPETTGIAAKTAADPARTAAAEADVERRGIL